MEKILEKIKEIRTQNGISQEFMASKLGIEQASYGLIENGKRKLKYETLEQIAIVFNMKVIDIITYPDVYVKRSQEQHDVNATLTIQLSEEKREEVLKMVLGEPNYKILTNQK